MGRLGVALVGAALVAAAAALAADDAPSSPKEAPRPLDPRVFRVGELIDDVAFTDLEGKAGRLSDWRGKTLVVALTNTGCPVCKRYGPRLAALSDEFGKRGAEFLFVDPTESDTADALRAVAKERGFKARLVLDADHAVSRALGAQTTADVFVLDGARTLVYRGPVDDQYGLGYQREAPRREYLREALETVLAGGVPRDAAFWAPGCLLPVPCGSGLVAEAAPTWHGRVARIVQRNCQECHREGENGPFPLMTYADAKANAEMVKLMVGKGAMPPWFAAATSGPFANDRSLSERDRADVLAWVDAGCPEGDAKDAPLPVAWEKGWKIGKPDLVVETSRSVAVAATGRMRYQYVVAYPEVAEDKWIAAMEVKPSAPQVVHHVLVFLRFPRSDPRFAPPDPGEGLESFFAAMVPGEGHVVFPEGTAKRLPRGANLVFQVHYTPNGTATEDRPRIAFRWAKRPPEREVRTTGIYDVKFKIPPGAENFEVKARRKIDEDIRVLAFMPHTHLRGKAFRFEIVRLDGKRATLVDVPHYDFNWQLAYRLREPLVVKKGEKLVATAWYDNSAKNPANPDPTATVRFGEQTSDEMMIGYFDWVPEAAER
jgi:peroxiredoxin/mono/diheme cytochrome c family protein